MPDNCDATSVKRDAKQRHAFSQQRDVLAVTSAGNVHTEHDRQNPADDCFVTQYHQDCHAASDWRHGIPRDDSERQRQSPHSENNETW